MYWRERDHPIPHLHAEQGGDRASIAIDGTILAGGLRRVRCVSSRSGLNCTVKNSWRTGTARATSRRSSASTRCLNITQMTNLPPLVHIVGVTVIGAHELRLLFEDGTVGDVAFGDEEWHGVFAPLRDPELFAQVRVDPQAGTIVWPGELDVAPEALYTEARRRQVAAPVDAPNRDARPGHRAGRVGYHLHTSTDPGCETEGW